MIDMLSLKLTNIIKNNLGDITEEKAEEINYGLNIIIYEFIVYVVLIPIMIISGLFKYCITYITIYGILRIFTGGAHAKTRLGCFLTYSISLFGICYLSKFIPAINLTFTIIVFLAGIFVFYIYAPGDTIEKPILSKKQIKKMKFLSIMLLLYIFIITMIIRHFNQTLYNVIIFTIIEVVFFLTPIGYKLYGCKLSWE